MYREGWRVHIEWCVAGNRLIMVIEMFFPGDTKPIQLQHSLVEGSARLQMLYENKLVRF